MQSEIKKVDPLASHPLASVHPGTKGRHTQDSVSTLPLNVQWPL